MVRVGETLICGEKNNSSGYAPRTTKDRIAPKYVNKFVRTTMVDKARHVSSMGELPYAQLGLPNPYTLFIVKTRTLTRTRTQGGD